jgi:hypothetical protein
MVKTESKVLENASFCAASSNVPEDFKEST